MDFFRELPVRPGSACSAGTAANAVVTSPLPLKNGSFAMVASDRQQRQKTQQEVESVNKDR
jgi:hypothetical protein